jgi:hypothetical protein
VNEYHRSHTVVFDSLDPKSDTVVIRPKDKGYDEVSQSLCLNIIHTHTTMKKTTSLAFLFFFFLFSFFSLFFFFNVFLYIHSLSLSLLFFKFRENEEYEDEDELDELNMNSVKSSISLDELLVLSTDFITSAQVNLGVPYIGRLGKRHPVFDIVLFGKLKTKRIRSYRFKVFFNNNNNNNVLCVYFNIFTYIICKHTYAHTCTIEIEMFQKLTNSCICE